MKILAFVDVHENVAAWEKIKEKVRKHDPDIIICAGDITIFENDIENQMKKLKGLGGKILLIPGNHETPEILYMLSKPYKNVIFLHGAAYKVGDIVFFGFGGSGFTDRDTDFEKASRKFLKDVRDERIVLINHAPPYNTKLDKLGTEHAGNKSYRKFIEKNNVVLSISGHFHENSGSEDVIKGKRLINPGPFGKIINI